MGSTPNFTRSIAPVASQKVSRAYSSRLSASQPEHYDQIKPQSSLDISNHYAIFSDTLRKGPPPTGPFSLDVLRLKAEYLKLQGRFHPDRFSAEEKSKAEALSSRINEAYRTLQDPLLRAQYILLHVYDIDVTSENNNSHPSDPSTLMEVMEAQENIEQAESEERIAELKKHNEARVEASIRSLEDSFARSDVEHAKAETVKLQYWASLAQSLSEWNGKGSEVRLHH